MGPQCEHEPGRHATGAHLSYFLDLSLREDGDGAHLSSELIEPSSTRWRRLRPTLCAAVTNLAPIPWRLQAAREAVVDPVVLASVKARPVSLLGAFWHIREESGAAALPRCRTCIHPQSDLRLAEQVHRYLFCRGPNDRPARCRNARFPRLDRADVGGSYPSHRPPGLRDTMYRRS